jgi:hypothetical protein
VIIMDKKSIFTKILAILGTILVWLTLLAPVFFWLLFSLRRGVLTLNDFDYLIPAELFPLALVGAGLLVWAALRARRYLKLIAGSLSLAIVALFSGQLLAVLTGLASGETKPGGWQWAVVVGAIVVYILALVILGVGGMLLVRELQER